MFTIVVSHNKSANMLSIIVDCVFFKDNRVLRIKSNFKNFKVRLLSYFEKNLSLCPYFPINYLSIINFDHPSLLAQETNFEHVRGEKIQYTHPQKLVNILINARC